MTSRYWILTWNNPDWDPSEKWDSIQTDFPDIRYIYYQYEKGKKGTTHIQGYIEYKRAVRFAAVKKLFEQAHIEKVRSPTHARDYCGKEDTRVKGPFELGQRKRQGQRSDLEKVSELLKRKATDYEIANECTSTFIKYYKGIRETRLVLSQTRKELTKVIFVYGPPGCGKSTYVNNRFPDAYWKSASNKWFDSYCCQETVVFDDFDGTWFTISTLKQLMDRFPVKVETKGSTVEFLAKTLVITSNFQIKDWYRNVYAQYPHQLLALERRINEMIIFTAVGKYEQILCENESEERSDAASM